MHSSIYRYFVKCWYFRWSRHRIGPAQGSVAGEKVPSSCLQYARANCILLTQARKEDSSRASTSRGQKLGEIVNFVLQLFGNRAVNHYFSSYL